MRFCFLLLLIFFFSCSSESEIEKPDEIISNNEITWSINKDDLQGEIGLFKVMNSPKFVNVSEIDKLNDSDKVALVSFNGKVRIYPYYYTNYYEVVNDVIDENYIAISYCPITESAICFNRNVNGKIYDIIASGYLYKDNMVAADKNHSFYWSQMLSKIIGGENQNNTINHYNLIETTWKTAKTFFSNSEVFYHDNVNSAKFQNKKKVNSVLMYGILNKKTEEEIELFNYDLFSSETKILNRILNNKNVIIIGNKNKSLITSFYTKESLNFSLLSEDKFPNIITDNEGNIWNIFGYAISGPRKGTQLESPRGYVAQEWAWKDFYKNLIIN